jgi:multiple sugar transport system permease protein
MATKFFALTGGSINQQIMAPKLRWLAKHEPEVLNQAKTVDGATPFARFFLITLSLLRPVMGVVLILQTIVALRTYDLIYVLTRGGPGDATDLYAYFTYRQAFLGLDLAKASALAYILLLVTLILVFFYYQRVFTR